MLFPNIPMSQFHTSFSIFIPLSFMFIGLQDEKGVYNKSGLLKFILTAIILLLSYELAVAKLLIVWIKDFKIGFELPFMKPLNDIGFVLFLTALFFCLLRMMFKPELKNVALIISLVCVMTPFLFSTSTYNVNLFFALGVGFLGSMLIHEIYKIAFIDALTKVPSRRSLEEYCKGLRPPFTLCMVDIDRFKKINDTYGHDVGDEVLRYVAKELQKTKGGGKVFRYGGEEFTIIYPNKLSYKAEIYLETVRENIFKKAFVIRNKNRDKSNSQSRVKKVIKNRQVKVSVSLGLCDTQSTRDINDMFVYADQALYKAKKDGRNCLKIYMD